MFLWNAFLKFFRISGKTSAIYQSQYRPKTTKLQYVAYVFLGIFWKLLEVNSENNIEELLRR